MRLYDWKCLEIRGGRLCPAGRGNGLPRASGARCGRLPVAGRRLAWQARCELLERTRPDPGERRASLARNGHRTPAQIALRLARSGNPRRLPGRTPRGNEGPGTTSGTGTPATPGRPGHSLAGGPGSESQCGCLAASLQPGHLHGSRAPGFAGAWLGGFADSALGGAGRGGAVAARGRRCRSSAGGGCRGAGSRRSVRSRSGGGLGCGRFRGYGFRRRLGRRFRRSVRSRLGCRLRGRGFRHMLGRRLGCGLRGCGFRRGLGRRFRHRLRRRLGCGLRGCGFRRSVGRRFRNRLRRRLGCGLRGCGFRRGLRRRFRSRLRRRLGCGLRCRGFRRRLGRRFRSRLGRSVRRYGFHRRLGCRLRSRFGRGFRLAALQSLASSFLHLADTLRQLEAFLYVTLEADDVGTGVRLPGLQGIQRFFQVADGLARLGLSLGLAGLGSILQLGASLVQFFLGFATLLFKFGQELFRIDQRLFARTFQVLDKAVGKLLQQVQGGGDGLLVGRHDVPPGGRGCAHTRPANPLSPTGSMCYKRRAPGLPADSSGETACRAAFSSVFFYCRCRFSPRPPRTNWPMP
nr:hypothetical 62.8K protein - Pseudomonas aeruginosa [Pseudomonas aeruginosa]